jgi:molybdenum cofactor cytidylyltransferase
VSAAPPRVAAVLLAAGASRRLGRPKQLLDWHGEPLVRRVARQLVASRAASHWAVLGHRAAEVGAALDGLSLRQVLNPRWESGQASSVHAAIDALTGRRAAERERRVDAALFVPCDQPFLSAAVLDRLIDAFATTAAGIVVPCYPAAGHPRGRRGAPVLFAARLFDALRGLQGDAGGRQLFDARASELVDVPIDDPRAGLDVDTDEDLQKLLAADSERL